MPTKTVVVRRRLKASPTLLLQVLSQPDLLSRVRGIRGVDVITEGHNGPDSAGTVRRVRFPAGFLTEEIVGLSPTRFDYVIRDSALPVQHLNGFVRFADRGRHTEAVWSSTFAFNQPVIGGTFALLAVAACRAAFAAGLKELDRVAASLPASQMETP